MNLILCDICQKQVPPMGFWFRMHQPIIKILMNGLRGGMGRLEFCHDCLAKFSNWSMQSVKERAN